MKSLLIKRIDTLCEKLKQEGYPTSALLRWHKDEMIIDIKLKQGEALQISKVWERARAIEGG